MRVYVSGVGVFAPGLDSWMVTRRVLRGDQIFAPVPQAPPAPTILPANERRRTTATIRLALQAASEALQHSGIAAESAATVFATSGGDYDVLHSMCSALAAGSELSPTTFHNSVHNAAAGYWSIATRSHMPTSTIAAWDWSFAMGLLEAVAVGVTEGVPVLLVTYDHVPPEPLWTKRPLRADFAAALALQPSLSANCLAALEIELGERTAASPMGVPDLEAVRLGNPAAQVLPVLAALDQAVASRVVLDCGEQSLSVRIAPCRS